MPRCTGLGFSPDQSMWRWTTPLITFFFPPPFDLIFFVLFFVLSPPPLPSVSKISGFLAGINHAFDSVEFMTKLWALIPEEVFSGTKNVQCKLLDEMKGGGGYKEDVL